MLTLIKNEHKKLFKSIRTLFLLLILIIPVIFVVKPTLDTEVDEAYKLTAAYRIKSVKEKINYTQNQISQITGDAKLTADQKKIKIDTLTEDIKYLKKEIEYANKTEEEGTYSKDEKKRINDYELKWASENLASSPNLEKKFTFDVNYIKEVVSKGFYLNENNKATAMSFLLNLLNITSLPILYFLVLFVGLNHITREYNNKVLDTHSIASEYTGTRFNRLTMIPKSRTKIYLSKVISMFLYLVIPMTLIFTLAFAIFAALKGIGPTSFPQYISGSILKIAHGSGFVFTPDPLTSKFVPIWQYLLYIYLFQLLFIFTTCTFISLVQILVKHSNKSILITALSFPIIYLMPRIFSPFSKYLSHLFFFSYYNPVWLFNSNLAQYYDNPFVTPLMGLIVLIISSIVFLVIGVKTFNNTGFTYKFEKVDKKNRRLEVFDSTNYKNFKLNI